MEFKIEPSWKRILSHEFDQAYFNDLTNFVKSEYKTGQCYPPAAQLFGALEHCPFDEVEVVILGQDPYHGKGQAHGLCFSVNDSIAFPPSLRNIFEEIKSDIGTPVPKSGNLERWAKQGVLLLNATLSVREGQAGSHQGKGWETFTDAIIKTISAKKENVVFLLWGGYAKKKSALVDKNKHLVLESGHPSPLSANKGHWFGNRHFSRTNEFLRSKNKREIQW